MGYESRIYIVEKFDTTFYEDNKCYARVISMFNMCKFPALADAMRYKPETNCYFYADDGNTRIEEDCYGKPLMVASLSAVITRLKIIARDEDYWRAKVALDFLESVRKTNPNCKVYHFGY